MPGQYDEPSLPGTRVVDASGREWPAEPPFMPGEPRQWTDAKGNVWTAVGETTLPFEPRADWGPAPEPVVLSSYADWQDQFGPRSGTFKIEHADEGWWDEVARWAGLLRGERRRPPWWARAVAWALLVYVVVKR